MTNFCPGRTSGAETRKSRPRGQAAEGHRGQRHGGGGGRPERASRFAQSHDPEPQRRQQPEGRPAGQGRAAQQRETEALACDRDEVEGCYDGRHGFASLAEDERDRGQGAGHDHDEERAQGALPVHEGRDAEAEDEVGSEEYLEEGDGEGQGRRQEQVAAPLAGGMALEGEERSQRQREGGDDRVRREEREQEVAAQEVGPPVSLGIGSEDEGEVGEEERPGDEGHERGRSEEAVGERAQHEDEREGEHGDVEAADGVVGVDRRPAERGRPHEIRSQVVADGEARHSGQLGRVADHQLARQPYVKRGVRGDERVEEEVTVRGPPVPGILGQGEQDRERDERRPRAPEGRPRGRSDPMLDGQRDQKPGHRNRIEPGEAGDGAEPVEQGGAGGAQGEHQGRVGADPRQALESDAGADEGHEHE